MNGSHDMLFELQVLTEYILVSATSAITVTIAGVVKEAVTILVRIEIYFSPNRLFDVYLLAFVWECEFSNTLQSNIFLYQLILM
jgi:hypothetical protein